MRCDFANSVFTQVELVKERTMEQQTMYINVILVEMRSNIKEVLEYLNFIENKSNNEKDKWIKIAAKTYLDTIKYLFGSAKKLKEILKNNCGERNYIIVNHVNKNIVVIAKTECEVMEKLEKLVSDNIRFKICDFFTFQL